MEEWKPEQILSDVKSVLSEKSLICVHADKNSNLDFIAIFRGNIPMDEVKKILLNACGLKEEDVNVISQMSKEDIEMLKKRLKLQALKKEVESLEKEVF